MQHVSLVKPANEWKDAPTQRKRSFVNSARGAAAVAAGYSMNRFINDKFTATAFKRTLYRHIHAIFAPA